jgi:hypothetical protein
VRKGTDDIGKAACLGERSALRRDHQNAHVQVAADMIVLWPKKRVVPRARVGSNREKLSSSER